MEKEKYLDVVYYDDYAICTKEHELNAPKIDVDLYRKKDYEENKKKLETISVDADLWFECSAAYLDDIYVKKYQLLYKDELICMTSNKYNLDLQKREVSYVLQTNILFDMLKKYDISDNSTNISFCNYIASLFMHSDYGFSTKSLVNDLDEWIDNNEIFVKEKYQSYLKSSLSQNELIKKGIVESNNKIKVIDFGKRRDENIALVLKTFDDGTKEYIVAVNYKVNNYNLEWGYGFYYDNNLDKATKDFKKVISGESIYSKDKDKDGER